MNGRAVGARAGFATFTLLFVLVVVGGFLLDAALRAQAERRIAWNTAVEVRARAASGGGLAHALLRLRELQARTVSSSGSDPALFDAWNRIDTLGVSLGEVALPGGGGYRVEIRDAASRLPLNAATADELHRLFVALGVESGAAASSALSLADQRERVGPYISLDAVAATPGAEGLPRSVLHHLTLLGEGRVNLNTATEPVLGALPGMTDEAVEVVLQRRDEGRFLRSLFELEAALSAPARAEMQRNFAALSRRAGFEPVLLEVTTWGWVEGARLRARLHTVGVRAGSTVQVVSSIEE